MRYGLVQSPTRRGEPLGKNRKLSIWTMRRRMWSSWRMQCTGRITGWYNSSPFGERCRTPSMHHRSKVIFFFFFFFFLIIFFVGAFLSVFGENVRETGKDHSVSKCSRSHVHGFRVFAHWLEFYSVNSFVMMGNLPVLLSFNHLFL